MTRARPAETGVTDATRTMPPTGGAGPRQRLLAIDIARSAAILGMVVFHFARDLEMFALIVPGTTLTAGWALFARGVAGSFLFLAGVSLVLAHGEGIRWRAFWRRFLTIAAAAGLVSLATYLAAPRVFVFFGILHAIAAASLVGLVALRLPIPLLLAAAAAAFVLPDVARAEVFDAPWLLWLGLAVNGPATLDYVPLLPWLAPFFLGLAAARFAARAELWPWLHRLVPGHAGWAARLAWPGRHSLAIYLIHQPVLIGLLWSVLWLRG